MEDEEETLHCEKLKKLLLLLYVGCSMQVEAFYRLHFSLKHPVRFT